ncbi:MAG: alkaline phosphatase family protein [Kofleriaceae bacterium]
MSRPAPTIPTAATRHVVAAALGLLVVGTVGVVQAVRAGSSFMFDLEQVTPALARAEPIAPDAKTPRLARRVFLVIVDGLSLDHSYELPFLDDLRRRGVDSEASSHYPTWSRPNYVSILTGVPPMASGVRTNHHYTPVQLDTLMDRTHAAKLTVASATDYDVLPRLFLRKRGEARAPLSPEALDDMVAEAEADLDEIEIDEAAAGVHAPDADLVSPFDDARYAPWPGGFSEAGAALVEEHADLVVMLVGAVDAAGHEHGAASEEYRVATEGADRALARVLGNVDLANDAIVVVADHGHTERGGHGGVEPEVLAVPLVAAGAGIIAGTTPKDARLIDVAPTVAALLGIPAPGHGLGRTLVEILALSPDDAARRLAADNARLTATTAIVAAAEARAAVARLAHRAARFALVGGGVALAIVLAIVLRKRRVLSFDVRALLVTVPAFFIVYYALIGLLGQRFSPSLLPAQGHLAGTLIRFGIAAAIVQLLANLWALHDKPTLAERLASANGIAWVGLLLAMVPAGVLWAIYPPPYVTLPGPSWLVLIPAVQVAVAAAAVTVALTLLVEVIIFASRAWQRRP